MYLSERANNNASNGYRLWCKDTIILANELVKRTTEYKHRTSFEMTDPSRVSICLYGKERFHQMKISDVRRYIIHIPLVEYGRCCTSRSHCVWSGNFSQLNDIRWGAIQAIWRSRVNRNVRRVSRSTSDRSDGTPIGAVWYNNVRPRWRRCCVASSILGKRWITEHRGSIRYKCERKTYVRDKVTRCAKFIGWKPRGGTSKADPLNNLINSTRYEGRGSFWHSSFWLSWKRSKKERAELLGKKRHCSDDFVWKNKS